MSARSCHCSWHAAYPRKGVLGCVESTDSPLQGPNIRAGRSRIAQERLKLWLLLEAGAADKAETQLMKLVKLSTDAATGDSDLAAN